MDEPSFWAGVMAGVFSLAGLQIAASFLFVWWATKRAPIVEDQYDV